LLCRFGIWKQVLASILNLADESFCCRYDLDRCELSHESAPLHVGSVLSVQISDNGKLLLTGGSEGLVKVWALPENGAGGPTERKCQSFVGHPSAVTCVQFTADKKQVVSAGVGYGILVWDLMADAAEDLSDFVDRLIEQRAAEMQATDAKMAAELAEDSTPEFPQLFSVGGGAGGPSTEASFIDSIRKLNVPAADPDASDLSSEYDTAPVNNRADEPSPLARVRERAHNLDISLTMTPAAPARESEQGGQGRGLLPLIHYRSRRLQPLRAERKFVAPEHEAGLKIVQMVGLNAEGRGSLAWHPASGVLATGVGSTVMVEQLETGAKRFLQGHDTDISCLALSLDGSMLASARGSADAAVPPVVVWAIDSAKPEPLLQLNCHHEGVQCLAWSDDGRYLLSVGNYLDGKMGILSTDTREMLLTTDLLHPVHAAVFSPGGREVVTAGHLYVTFWRFKADGAGNIQVFREERTAPNEEPGAHYTCIDLSPDGLTFYVGSSTGGVSQWSLRGDHATCTASWTTEQGELTAIRIREGGVVTCGQEPHIRSWQLEADEAGEGYWQVTRETNLDSYVTSLQYDGANGVASTAAGSVYRLSDSAITPKSSAVRIGGGHAAKVTDLAYSERGDMAASCDEGGAVMVWAASGMELLRTFKPSSASCGCVAFSPSGKTVVAGYADGVVRHLAVGSAAATTSDAYLVSSGVPITAVAFASGGDPAVMVGSASGSITCSKIVSGSSSGSSMQVVSACPAAGSPVICLKQSADGKGTWLATCANGLLRVFTHDTYTGSSVLIHQDIIQNEAAIFADFSPSEPSILVCGGPGLGNGIYFYDFALKRIVKRFAGIDQVASSLAVSHSGTLITMGTEEALVKIVDYDEGTFQARPRGLIR
jgi:WD40 repeat protein